MVEIERGLHPPVLKVGNLTTRRVIADARDLVRGLYMAAESCEPGDVYNLGAETHYSVAEIIEAIRQHVKVDFSIQQDPELMRRCDEPIIFGDISKFKSRTGWKTEFMLTRTLQDMLDWWRARLASESKSAASN